MKIVPFDLEKAKAGAKVVTRSGREVFLFIKPCPNEFYPLMGIIEGSKNTLTWTNEGKHIIAYSTEEDLFLALEEYNEFEETRKDILYFLNMQRNAGGLNRPDWIDWLNSLKQDIKQETIIIPKFRVNDIITSSKNYAIKYRIKEVGVKNELGEYDYVVEDMSDNPEYKGRIHNISIKKVDDWGVLVEQNDVKWIKEDEELKRSIIDNLLILKHMYKQQDMQADYNKMITWLKELCPPKNWKEGWCEDCKTRYNQWKPTTDQLKHLRYAIGICKSVNEHTDAQVLETLLSDLTNL